MKTKILVTICSLLLVACTVLSILLVSVYSKPNADAAEESSQASTDAVFAASSTDTIQFKLSLLHIYSESQNVILTLPFTTVTITEMAIIKAIMTQTGSSQAAITYLNNYVDRPLNAAFTTMDDILIKFKAMTKKYNISASSPYTAKYNNLKAMFDSLRNASTELISRARSLILCISNKFRILQQKLKTMVSPSTTSMALCFRN
ncbi:MAG: hypothetical protein RR246_01505 [Clostridia bacterium]